MRIIPGLSSASRVLLARGERAVVDVEAEVVARAVHHPAAVVLAVLLVQRGLDVDALGQQAPVVQVLRDDPDGRIMDVAEPVARLACRDAGLLGAHGRRHRSARCASLNVPLTGSVRVMSAV